METFNQEIMLVSICIPCYNASKYLPDTLNALIHQTYKNLEIIIIDDHSTDNSILILSQFTKMDARFRYETAKSKGAAAARNQAYCSSNGEYVIYLDADDWIPNNFIETQVLCLKTKREVVVSKWGRFHHNEIINTIIDAHQISSDLTFEEWILSYWHNNTHMTCPGRVCMPRNLIEVAGLWDEDLSLNDDFDFYTRIFSNSELIRYNQNSIFHYRSGINGLSSKIGNEAYYSLYKSITNGINTAQIKLKQNKELNLCYANLLQTFIYETYPLQLGLITEANSMIKSLGGSDLKFPAGGKTKLANYFLGWKLVKRIKRSLQSKHID